MTFQMPRNSLIFYVLFLLWIAVAICIHYSYSPEEILRSINGMHSNSWDSIMKVLTRGGEGIGIIPLLLLSVLMFRGVKMNKWLIIAIIIAAILPSVVTNLLKSYFNEPRPLTVFAGEAWLHMVPNYDNSFKRSFPSGHTTGAFACMTICAFLSNRKNVLIPVALFLLAIGVAISRLYLLQHFWVDVLWGSVIGTLISTMVLMIYQKIFLKKRSQ